MEEKKQIIKNKQQMFIVIGVFCLTLLLGTITYAFFNYTRTGTANTIKTGRIAFNTEEGDTVTLDGLFPITTTGTVTASTPGVGSLQIHVTGDTTYNEGLEYLVKAVNVTGSNGASLPISVRIGYEASNNKSIGTADDSYFTNRGGNSSVYKVLSTNTIEDNGDLVVGYIAPGQTGIDGYITIMAWLDAANIAITDTNPEGLVRSVIATNYDNSACETVLDGVTNASTYCATASSLQSAIDNSDLTSEQIALLVNAGIVEEYTDGTTDAWVNGRTVFTTEEWNAMTANGVSFQVKVEANEGTWVEKLEDGTIASCPGCKYVFLDDNNKYYSFSANSADSDTLQTFADRGDILYDDYREVVTNSGRNYFLGFKFDGSGAITNAYACGIKGENPNQGTVFCLEGALSDTYGGNSATRTALYNANAAFLNQLYGPPDSETGYGCYDYTDSDSQIYCIGSVGAGAYADGDMNNSGGEVYTSSEGYCHAGPSSASCYEN